MGTGKPWRLLRNFPNAPLVDTWYADVLADALAGYDLAVGSEMVVSFDGDSSWYYGTDGYPGGRYDLVTVVLHELAHGLGFMGSLYISYNVAFCTVSGIYWPCPSVYDRLATDENGTYLLDYQNPVAMAGKLTSNAYLSGTNAMAQNGGNRVRLYTPAIWEEGTSYSHLHESFDSTPNALMTHSMGPGEALHNPGPIGLGMFKDMGWRLADTSPYVDISGPIGGFINNLYTYTASFWPMTTTERITYTWTATGLAPIAHTGRGVSDTTAFMWTTPGAKTVSVTAVGAGVIVSATLPVAIGMRVYLPIILKQQ